MVRGLHKILQKELGISLVNVFLSALWLDRNILHNNNGYFNTPHQN